MGVVGADTVAVAQPAPSPYITSVSPDSLEGSTEDQWLTILGHGYDEEFTVWLRAEGVNAHITDRSSLDFVSPSQVRVQATFGNQASRWTVQVVNSDSTASNVYAFNVIAPPPQIKVMRPVEREAGESGFTLSVYGSTISPHSTIQWNGRERLTTVLRTSDNPNALAIGLKAKIPAALIADAGRNEVRVYTPPPGGGLSPPMTLFTNPRPFYRTAWFYLLCVGGLIGIGFTMHWYRVKTLREKVLKKKVRARTESLQQEKQKTEAQAAQLREQAERLQELDAAKNRFFTNLSHEFRTPLTLIQEPIHDMLTRTNGDLGRDMRRRLKVADHNARRLEHLVEQLLDLARLEAGQMQLQLIRGNLINVTEQVVRAHTGLAERQHVTLQHCAATDRLEADFDVEKIQTLVGNLVSNALKFTPEGGTVIVTVAEGEGQAVIRVRDTGVGIPKEEKAHIFDRFRQVDSSPTRERDGTGIGLSLAKELAELHAGAIRVESDEGEGSTFTVTLPIKQPHAGKQGPNKKQGPNNESPLREISKTEARQGQPEKIANRDEGVEEDVEPPHVEFTEREGMPVVLVVEDNADMRAHLRRHLRAAYRVIEAKNGDEALKQIRLGRPDVIVSDVMMPEMDGIALCRRLKTDEELGDVPIILLTARAGERERVEGLETGADDYIEKPFSMATLKARMENLVGSRRRLKQRYRREVVMQPTGVSVTPEDEAYYEAARAVVEAHIGEHTFTVDRFAEAMHASKGTLRRKLKVATGQTPAAFIKRLRLEYAAKLLAQGTSQPVYQVARAVGYRNADHFAKIFREAFGTPPSQYPAEEND